MEFFWYKEIRPQQQEALDFVKNSKKKFVILELPTGTWKSLLSMLLTNNFDKSYILTSQKILQDQYERDFSEHWLVSVKWAVNYTCTINWETANNGVCKVNHKIKKSCSIQWICPYLEKIKEAKKSKVANTNYSFFTSVNNAGSEPVLLARNLLICDEAHNLEKEIVNFASFKITKELMETLWIKEEIPRYKTIEEYWEFVEKLLNKTNWKIKELENSILIILKENGYEWNSTNEKVSLPKHFEKLVKKYNFEIENLGKLSSKLEKFQIFIKDEEWIFNYDDFEREVEFKPVTIWTLANDLFFSYAIEKVVLMSATILDKKAYCESIWLDEEEADFFSLESDFPIKNREVKCLNTCRLSRDKIDENLWKILKDVEEIIRKNKWKKWIIHTHTFKIQKFIQDNISNDLRDKIIAPKSWENNFAIEKHKFAKSDTILMSPSMKEWVDLPWDLSEFQIIVKLWFPFLWDKWVKRKAEIHKDFLMYEMAKDLMQSCWRSIRNKEDKCITYILDSSFPYYGKTYKKFFPNWFYNSIDFSARNKKV